MNIEKSLLRVAFTSNATTQQPPINSATSCATTTQQAPANTASLLDIARNKLRNNHATTSEKDAQQAHEDGLLVIGDHNELDALIRQYVALAGSSEEYLATLLAARKRMAPFLIQADIDRLKAWIGEVVA